jgi:hypothetical protein
VKTSRGRDFIVNGLKNIPTETVEDRVAIIKFALDSKIFAVLPDNDSTELDREVAKAVLNVLLSCGINSLGPDVSEEEKKLCLSQFALADGYNILLFFLKTYKNTELRDMIAIILGKFYHSIKIPSEGEIVVVTLINSLKSSLKNDLSDESVAKHVINLLNAFVSISLSDGNKALLIKKEIIPILYHLINTPHKDIYKNAIIILGNICHISSTKEKNNIIKSGIFTILLEKLLKISPPPPGNMEELDYDSIGAIFGGISNLLDYNPSGFSSFLYTPLILVCRWTLDSTISLSKTSPHEDVHLIQRCICSCFLSCPLYSYDNIVKLIEMKVIDKMMSMIEIYVSQLEEKKSIIDEDAAKICAAVIFRSAIIGFTNASYSKSNKFEEEFTKDNKLNRLVEVFKSLFSLQSPSSLQKEIMSNISISICFLLKNKKPPSSYDVVLSYVNTIKTSPRPTSGPNFPIVAGYALDGMMGESFSLWKKLNCIVM